MPGETPTQFNVEQAAGATVPPTLNDVKSALTNAAAAATSAATAANEVAGASLPGVVKSGWDAFSTAIENSFVELGETAASAFGGPLAGAAADVVLPDVVPMLANSIGALFNHIGAAMPADLKDFLDKL